ncbi:hypothetical protein ACFQHV_15705 [Promicromonospora thailandica]|nr:hypothetical protein [Promicromonospora thailandica]
MRRIASGQAHLLREALAGAIHKLPARISVLIPSIVVVQVARLPAEGITYWANHRWHIHLREEDPAHVKTFTVLWHLKRIVDHPLRKKRSELGEPEWDALASHFANVAMEADHIEQDQTAGNPAASHGACASRGGGL